MALMVSVIEKMSAIGVARSQRKSLFLVRGALPATTFGTSLWRFAVL
jgi:hypothetical protein